MLIRYSVQQSSAILLSRNSRGPSFWYGAFPRQFSAQLGMMMMMMQSKLRADHAVSFHPTTASITAHTRHVYWNRRDYWQYEVTFILSPASDAKMR